MQSIRCVVGRTEEERVVAPGYSRHGRELEPAFGGQSDAERRDAVVSGVMAANLPAGFLSGRSTL
jgi:hypothetical protein